MSRDYTIRYGSQINRVYSSHSIVAIHGLDGHREDSWTAENGVLWLRDLLIDEVPPARILTYGYDANTRGKEQLTSQTLYDHAETLIAKLVLFRKKTSVCNVIMSPMTIPYIGTVLDGEQANYICGSQSWWNHPQICKRILCYYSNLY